MADLDPDAPDYDPGDIAAFKWIGQLGAHANLPYDRMRPSDNFKDRRVTPRTIPERLSTFEPYMGYKGVYDMFTEPQPDARTGWDIEDAAADVRLQSAIAELQRRNRSSWQHELGIRKFPEKMSYDNYEALRKQEGMENKYLDSLTVPEYAGSSPEYAGGN